jgi:hypothetical protein
MSGLVEIPPHHLLAAFQAFFALSIGHAMMDFPFQGEYIATGKNWRLLKKLQDPSRPVQIWIWCMSAHCFLHAGSVWMITGSFLLCLIEFTAHWIIDVLKCSGKTNFHQDQLMHYFCKLSYAVVLYLGCKPPF